MGQGSSRVGADILFWILVRNNIIREMSFKMHFETMLRKVWSPVGSY